LIYSTLLSKFKYLSFESTFFINLLKIVISLVIMTLALYYSINFFEDKLIYNNYYKSIYLIMIIILAATIYLLLLRIFGVFKIKKFITS